MGWNDKCAGEALGVAQRTRLPPRVADCVDELRLAEGAGDRTHVIAGIPRFMGASPKLSVRSHATPSRRRWPSQAAPCLGFEVDTKSMPVRLTAGKKEKVLPLFARCASASTGDLPSAREIPQ